MTVGPIRYLFRHDTAANWTTNDPTLLEGEMGVETDTHKQKMGDGSTAWTSLAYITGVSGPSGPSGPTGAGPRRRPAGPLPAGTGRPATAGRRSCRGSRLSAAQSACEARRIVAWNEPGTGLSEMTYRYPPPHPE